MTIRPAEPQDGPGITEVARLAFNPPPEWVAFSRERRVIERHVVAVDGDRVVASGMAHRMQTWFGGRPVPTAGLAGVVTHPLYRGGGVATGVGEELLRQARRSGAALATLYPATVPVYRRLGFDYAGVQTAYRMPLEALPSVPASEVLDVVEPDPERGVRAIQASFRRLAERENGLFAGTADDWWQHRVLMRDVPGRTPPLVVVTEDGGSNGGAANGPDGYATYRLEDRSGSWGYDVECAHLVAHTRPAMLGLLAHLRRFKGMGTDLVWFGPPAEPLAFLLAEQSLVVDRAFRFLSRILDVPAAFEARGYPPDVVGEAVIEVHDDLFADNAGRFVLRAAEGRVGVSNATGGGGTRSPIGIGALTSMFAGYLSPPAAAALGLIGHDDPAMPLLTRLLAGSAPWSIDFF